MDIHTHILPGIDDGSSNWDETMRMVEEAYNEGIHIMIATPHYGLYNPSFNISLARQLVAETNRRIEQLPLKLGVFIGNEIYYVPGIVRDVITGKAATMAGSSYVLIEFSETVSYEMAAFAVQEFTRECYRPIIAHAERYSNLIDRDLKKIRKLRELGAYIQVNISSFMRKNRLFRRDNLAAAVRSMLQADLIDFVASDAHNASSRKPVMSSAVSILRELASDEQLDRLFYHNLVALSNNEHIER